MNREPGYYWVKFAGEWQPAQFHGISTYFNRDWWSILDSENRYSGDNFDEIGDRIVHE